MKLSLLSVSAALAGFVSAQSSAGGSLPSCAQGCVGALLPASCNLNPTCICQDATFITNISCCIAGACPAADQAAALNFAKSVCQPAGVTLPQSASCAPGSTYIVGSSGSAAATSASGSASSTAAPASNSASSTASGSHSSITSAASMTGTSGSSAAASTAAASSSSSKAAGERLAAQGISLLGAVAGAVVLL